jgi:hypothetical protein
MRPNILKTILVLLVLLLMSQFVNSYFGRPSPGITLKNLGRIHAGMSEKEVEEILGEKGKGITRFTTLPNTRYWDGGGPPWEGNYKGWVAEDGGVIWVGLENDQVIWAEAENFPPSKGFFQRIKEWLGF